MRDGTPSAGGPAAALFGDYRIVREIARGGMGVVYEAFHDGLSRRVALKLLLRPSDAMLQRFRREVATVASLRHPNIVTVYEAGEREGQPFMAMEFLEGWSLDQLIREGLTPHDAAVIVLECARAMSYAHARGVLHRDLKPANIIVDSSRTPKVTDFGLAKVLGAADRLTQTGTILGTPFYMPPEQLRAAHDVGPQADVYALGAILYEALSGTPPYRAASPIGLIKEMERGLPPPPSRICATARSDESRALLAALDAIVIEALAFDPAGRQPSAAALAEDLDAAVRGAPAPPIGTERASRVRRRVLAAALLLLLAAGGGFLLQGLAASRSGPTAPPAAPREARNVPVRPADGTPRSIEEAAMPALPLLERRRLAGQIQAAIAVESPRAGEVLAELAAAAPTDPLALVLRPDLDRFGRPQAGGEAERILSVLDDRLARTPDDAEALLARAQILFGAGRTEEALLVCRRATTLAPSDPWAHHLRAMVLSDLARTAEAAEAEVEAARLAPDVPMFTLTHLGFVYSSGDRARGLALAESAVERFPREPYGFQLLGGFLMEAGRVAEGEAAFDRAVECDPRALLPRRLRGRVREVTGRIDLALEDYRLYATGRGEMPDVYVWAGLLEAGQDNREGALSLLSDAIDLDARNAQALYHRARLRAEAGNTAEALADIERAIEASPAGSPNLARCEELRDRIAGR